MDEKRSTKRLLSNWYSFHLKLVLQGIIIGLISGLVIVFYRIAIGYGDTYRGLVYEKIGDQPSYMLILWFLLLALVGIILGYLIKFAPMSKGSGIPQIKGFLIK